MKIKLDTIPLAETIQYFYMLTGIRTVIFDGGFQEVFAYPREACPFCRTIRTNADLREKCRKSDLEAFHKCREEDKICIYQCHAGLVEAALPIKHENRVIGYIMLGQITDIKDKKELRKLGESIHQAYGIDCEIAEIKYKTKNQILAASKLLEVCTAYLLLKEMVGVENEKIVGAAREYIRDHIAEEITIEALCQHTDTNRTRLYEMFRKECGMGIAAYIRETRMAEARRRLRETEATVAEVSAAVGFYDYNYFSRVYKRRFGLSPRKEKAEL